MEARLLLVYVGLTVRPLYSMADVSNADEGKGRLRCTTTDSHISEGPRVLCLSCAINDSFRVTSPAAWPLASANLRIDTYKYRKCAL